MNQHFVLFKRHLTYSTTNSPTPKQDHLISSNLFTFNEGPGVNKVFLITTNQNNELFKKKEIHF